MDVTREEEENWQSERMTNFTVREEPGAGAVAVAEGQAVGGKLKKKARNLDGLAHLVAGFIPPEIFAGERERVYSAWVTFVAFLGQALTRGSTCREGERPKVSGH